MITIKQKKETLLRSFLFTFMIFITLSGGAQTKTASGNTIAIKGIVSDSQGPIIGATVAEKGTTNGTITDIDGTFEMKVKSNATIIVTFVGLTPQEIPVNNKTDFNIKMIEQDNMLDEIVLIGFGSARKKDVTGTIVRANLGQVQESPNVSIASALQGVIPGLNVSGVSEAGKAPKMSIRGRTTISGSTSPLIVLDGIIFRGSIMDLNPNDIESIDVLKDASASAIYGSEASNGVIIIASKTGKSDGKPMVEYNFSASFQRASHSLEPGDRDYFLKKLSDRWLEESHLGPDYSQLNPNWDIRSRIASDQSRGYDDGLNTNWWDLLTNDNPYIMSHNVSVKGRSETSGYFLSFGYTDQKNLIINDEYKRYNGRINIDSKINNWLKIGAQTYFSMGDKSGKSPQMYDIATMSPLLSPYDKDGELLINPYRNSVNPLLAIQEDKLDKHYSLSGTFFAEITVPKVKGLTYRINNSHNLTWDQLYEFGKHKGPSFTSEASKLNKSKYTISVDNIINYNRTFDKHSIALTAAYGGEKIRYEDTKATARNLRSDALSYNSLILGQSDINTIASGAWKESSLYSMFRLIYTFNDRYIFTGTFRRDGFSGFGANHKFGTFPSAALAWRVNEEQFLADKTWIDNLKLRVSFGQNGNRSMSRYQTLARYKSEAGYLFGDGATGELMQYLNQFPNADLKWETTTALNIGIDFSFLRNRIFGDMNFYNSSSKNMLYDIAIPILNGKDKITDNIGKLANKGVELSVTGIPIKTKDFSWSITYNYSLNRNKVKSINGKDNKITSTGGSTNNDKSIFIDEPYGLIYDYRNIGMWQMEDHLAGRIPTGFRFGTYKIEDRDGDGTITPADRDILGYTDPSYRFSIQNTFNYKDWEFKFLINSVQGGKDYYWGAPANSTSKIPNPDNISGQNTFKFDYWTPDNPNARYRQIGFYSPSVGETYHPIQQRNFIRLQDITLSYNVPKSILKKLYLNRLRVFVTGKNLFTITKWDGWDPETGQDSGGDITDNGTGMDLGAYPVMKSYSFGLSIEF